MSKKLNTFVIFHIDGGMGKNIAATSVINSIIEKYPNRKLIVVAGWPEIFMNNPKVYRVYRAGLTPYFYEDYIKNKDVIILKQDPYNEQSHILEEKHVVKTWIEMFDLPDAEIKPEIFFNKIQTSLAGSMKRDKPIMLLHTNGGPAGPDNKMNYSWARDIPREVVELIVATYKEKYSIIQICREESQGVKGVEVASGKMSAYEMFALLRVSTERILIDSMLQHAAAAFGLPSNVLWIGTSPKVFGYELHNNIQADLTLENGVKLPDSYMSQYSLRGEIFECPYYENTSIFTPNKLIPKLKLNI